MNRMLPRGEFLPVPLLSLHHVRPADVAGGGRAEDRVSRAGPARRCGD